ncbi:MAG TPA: methyltransferase [Terriglobia bacterium]|nr:methyltransferase [Terriglobia bacterium]
MFKAFSRKHLDRIKTVWGAARVWGGTDIRHWLQHPLVQERINLKVAGVPHLDRFHYFLEQYLKGKLPVERALTLGSGVGELERGLCHYDFARLHEGVDLSDDAVRLAREQAEAAGFKHLRYRTANLNSIVLDHSAYDVVFGISSIHHVDNLEPLLLQVKQALKPGGLFFLDEFVGPSRFQWTDAQLRLINEQLRLLPKELCRLISDRSQFKEAVVRKSPAEIIASDPSEAVHSAEILPLVSKHFRIIEVKGYGGTILHELLYDIAGNFCEENPGSMDCLRQLFKVEDQAIASGVLNDDFAVIIAAS